MVKPPKGNEVDTWFEDFDHPLREEMLAVRKIIMAADPRIDECVKWSAPTFIFNGNLASFNPRAKKHVSLMFHHGASIPGSYKCFEGEGDVARHIAFIDNKDIKKKTAELQKIVKAWCKLKA